MNPEDARVGLKFRDHGLTSAPEEARIHQITWLGEEEIDISSPEDKKPDLIVVQRMEALHINSGTHRQWDRTVNALKQLEPVPTVPRLTADLDCLVGEKVVIELTMGSQVRGVVTAVTYTHAKILGGFYKQVDLIQIDHDSGSAYPLSEIMSLEKAE